MDNKKITITTHSVEKITVKVRSVLSAPADQDLEKPDELLQKMANRTEAESPENAQDGLE